MEKRALPMVDMFGWTARVMLDMRGWCSLCSTGANAFTVEIRFHCSLSSYVRRRLSYDSTLGLLCRTDRIAYGRMPYRYWYHWSGRTPLLGGGVNSTHRGGSPPPKEMIIHLGGGPNPPQRMIIHLGGGAVPLLASVV